MGGMGGGGVIREVQGALVGSDTPGEVFGVNTTNKQGVWLWPQGRELQMGRVSYQSMGVGPGGQLCCFLPGCVSMKSKEMGPF